MEGLKITWSIEEKSLNTRYQAELVTGPTAEPLTLAEAKKQLEISSSDSTHDVQLQGMIQEARQQWEKDTDTVCCYQTWRMRTNVMKDGFRLRKRPIQSITSIQYYDSGNTLQTWNTSQYSLYVDQIKLGYQVTIPAVSDRWDAWTITYRLGYSQDATSVPAVAKRAMLLLIGYYFDANRGDNDRLHDMKAYEALVAKYSRSDYP